MSRMKRYAEKVSEDMGFGCESNDEVLEEAAQRLAAGQIDPDAPATISATAAAIIESGDLERGGAMMEPDAFMASIDYGQCPSHLRVGMRRWIENGVIPGGVLAAVLRNDLAGAIFRASDNSIAEIVPLVWFLHSQAPGGAHGSTTKVEEWADKDGLTGIVRGGNVAKTEG